MKSSWLLIFLQLLFNYIPSKMQSIPDIKNNNQNSSSENSSLLNNKEDIEEEHDDHEPWKDDAKYFEAINKKYQELLVSEKSLEDQYKSLLEENKNNAIKIGINKIYFKALSTASISLICLLFLIIFTKVYRICLSSHINSEFIENVNKKLINKKNENLKSSRRSESFNSKIIQNNINVSCYNLLNNSNLSVNDSEKNTSYNSNEVNYDAPIIASYFSFDNKDQKSNSKGSFNNELEHLTNKPQ